MNSVEKFVGSIAQIAPVLPINKKETTDKACEYITKAAKEGARLIVFPECFLPTYPNWSVDLNNPNEWATNLKDFTKESVEIDGPEIKKICEVARKNSIFVVVGINERQKPFDGLLYNSLVFISLNGEILNVHRKFFPTNREKVFHRRGPGNTLKVVNSSLGRIGGLICYEHLQPLLKYALISQGEQIHCASWPGWPNFPGGRSNKDVIDVASRQHAIEGQNFVLLSSLFIPPEEGEKADFGNASWTYFGGSGIINPLGEYIVGPVYDKEELIFGEIDLELILKRKAVVDTTGRDARWNIINMNIKGEEEIPIESFENLTNGDLSDDILKELQSCSNKMEEISDILNRISREK